MTVDNSKGRGGSRILEYRVVWKGGSGADPESLEFSSSDGGGRFRGGILRENGAVFSVKRGATPYSSGQLTGGKGGGACPLKSVVPQLKDFVHHTIFAQLARMRGRGCSEK